MKKIAALIVAAGRGQRFNAALPKQYHTLKGQPILRYTLAAFAAHPGIQTVQTVIHPDDLPLYEQAAADLCLPRPAFGGATRQESVFNGLKALAETDPDYVLIHDGARPFIDTALIDRMIESMEENKAAIPGLSVSDTLKKVDDKGLISDTVDRTALFAVQTPQAFHFDLIVSAHGSHKADNLTDDAALAEKAELPVALIEGCARNFKITTQADMDRARALLDNPPLQRIGNGFDVHAFDEGDHVTLCGVKIPHSKKLKGHSDADVAFHALTDALLGTIGAGDIGRHFPPSDPQWKGADSALFLRYAVTLITAQGGSINNIDLTILCEEPKIGPHQAAMTKRLSEILGLPAGRIGLKATTTEQLGFTGRKEGIAAQASCIVSL